MEIRGVRLFCTFYAYFALEPCSTSNALSSRLVVRLTRPNPLATSTTQAEAIDATEKFRRGRRLAYNVKELTRF